MYSEYSQTNFTDDAAIDEITADYASKLVNDVETFRELVRADKTVAERFIESVKEFIAKVKTTFSKDKTKADTASLEKYGATVSELEAAVKTYENMIKTTQTAVTSGQFGIENTAGEDTGGEEYDLKGKGKNLSRSEAYSYDELTRKKDMKLTLLDSSAPNNRADIISQAKKNATQIGTVNEHGNIAVVVDDIGKEVIIGTDGLKHSLNRGKGLEKNPNSFTTLRVGEILKNSIRINELTPSKDSASGSYVLIGAAKNIDEDIYIVRSVVNEYSNELIAVDVLYAVNTKKESAAQNAPRYAANPLSVTDFKISISQLLDYVNKYFPDVLPESVLRHYGHNARPIGDLGEAALFSLKKNTDNQGRELSENDEAEIVEDDTYEDSYIADTGLDAYLS